MSFYFVLCFSLVFQFCFGAKATCKNTASAAYCNVSYAGFCADNQASCANLCGVCDAGYYCADQYTWTSALPVDSPLNGGKLIYVQSPCFFLDRPNAENWMSQLSVDCTFSLSKQKIIVPATFAYNGTFACFTPPWPSFGTVTIDVSIAGRKSVAGCANQINYVKLSSNFSNLNGADGVKINEMQLSFNSGDEITLDFSKKFPPADYPNVYIYILKNDGDASPLIGLNDYQAIKNTNGTYTTRLYGFKAKKECPELSFIVTDYQIKDNSIAQNRQIQSTALGKYCPTTCKNGTADAIRTCIDDTDYRKLYSQYVMFYRDAVSDWAQYATKYESTLKNYGLDYTEAISAMGNCVYGCYVKWVLKNKEMVKRVFDAKAQCAILESSSAEEGVLTRGFRSALAGINNASGSINNCIPICVKLARTGKLTFPTSSPTKNPTKVPTKRPTKHPSKPPTKIPTKKPTNTPTAPTKHPTATTKSPTKRATNSPTKLPTKVPTKPPTKLPTKNPTKPPTKLPTKNPTKPPTKLPTKLPTKNPTTKTPTAAPIPSPTLVPTLLPTSAPILPPTSAPTRSPTLLPTSAPILPPTLAPTQSPTRSPTSAPILPPTSAPTQSPTRVPTSAPILSPTSAPTHAPTSKPTLATYTCTSTDKFSGVFDGSKSASAYFEITDSSVIEFSICTSQNTYILFGFSDGSSASSTTSTARCDTESAYYKIDASSPHAVGTIVTMNVKWFSNTNTAWTMDIYCSGRRRLQSLNSVRLASSVTISVIQEDCTPENWQQDISGSKCAITTGDPHFTQFDGSEFDFQGIGPYVLYNLEHFQIQGLFLKLSSSSSVTFPMGTAVKLSDNDYFTAFYSDKNRIAFNAFSNCKQFTALSSWQYSKRYRLKYLNNNARDISVQFYNGIYLTTTGRSTLTVCLPAFLRAAPSQNGGLFGNFDGTRKLDIVYPCSDSKCSTWQRNTKADNTIFCNCNSQDFNSLDSTTCSNRRLLATDDDNTTITFDYNSLNSSEKEYFNATCGSNSKCMYDLYFTGDEDIALDTKDSSETFVAEQKKIDETFACTPSCQNNASCLANNTCFCLDGFNGSRCEYNLSYPSYDEAYITSLLTDFPTASPSVAPSPHSSKKSLSTASIVGITIGVSIGVIVLAIFMYFVGFKMDKNATTKSSADIEMKTNNANA